MRAEAWLKDPVFQMNLLLWMAKEQPAEGYRVKPVFFELGFKILYIENPFPLPDTTVRAIRDCGMDISHRPSPELILGRLHDRKALYFEAKANSFGPDSSTARQARGHLLATGPAFREVLAPLELCLLCYVLPKRVRDRMVECLDSLVDELVSASLKPGLFSVHGLDLQDEHVVYQWDKAFKDHVGIPGDECVLTERIPEDTDPSPLVLVFSEEDCANTENRDFFRRVVIEQIRACLLSDLHAHEIGAIYQVRPDDLLMRTTDGIFEYIGRDRQGKLRKLVRNALFKRIDAHWRERRASVKLEGDVLTIAWQVVGEKEELLEWLEDRRTKFDASRPPDELPTLFDGLEPPDLR